MTAARRTLLLVAWIATVAILGWIVNRHLVIGTDLRLFMPSPQTPQERLILEEIGEGPASRMLLLAISGPDPQAAADTSRALASALRTDGEFRLVANGESSLDAIPDSLLAYRYLLSSTLDHSVLDAEFLGSQLEERVRDLASPAAGFLESWLPRDPTLELLKLADSWLPARQPQVVYDVWFDSSGKEALLVAETRAAGFDPQGQRKAADALRHSFEATRDQRQPATRSERSGGVLGTHAGTHAAGGAVDRHRRRHRHRDPAAGGLPQPVGAGTRAAAARQRGRRGPGGGRHHLRYRARHHPRLRFHLDRRRPGLSDTSVQPPASRARCPVQRARPVADARHRSREHLHRLPGLPVFRRPRSRAGLGIHGHGPRGGGTDHTIPVAAAGAEEPPRRRRLRTAWPALACDRGTAPTALARRRDRDSLRRLPGALASTAMGEQSRCADASATQHCWHAIPRCAGN